jgi:hypothetical protein
MEDRGMKKEFKNVRIETDNGEAVLLSRKRYYCLLQTLDLLASGAYERNSRRTGGNKPVTGRN